MVNLHVALQNRAFNFSEDTCKRFIFQVWTVWPSAVHSIRRTVQTLLSGDVCWRLGIKLPPTSPWWRTPTS